MHSGADMTEATGVVEDSNALQPWSARRSLKMQRSVKRLTVATEAEKFIEDMEAAPEIADADAALDGGLEPAGNHNVRRKTLLSEAEEFLATLGLRGPGQRTTMHQHDDSSDSDSDSESAHSRSPHSPHPVSH
jgi:hypothetical protein